MASPGGRSVGRQALTFSLPQIQRTAAHPEFVGQLADVLAMFHPLDGIPLKANWVSPRSSVLLFCHDTLRLMKVSNFNRVSKLEGSPLGKDERP
jgi:hypothetical protein